MAIQGRSGGRWLAAIVTSGALGCLIALFSAMLLIIGDARNRLAQYAADFMSEDEHIAENIDQVLAEGNRSSAAECSQDDLALLRRLLFLSPYLKDVGRIKNGDLICSAVAGRLTKPFHGRVEAATNYQGRKIYYNVDLQIAPGMTAEIVEEGRTNVVVSPDVFDDFSRPPMQFTGAIVDRKLGTIFPVYSNSTASMPLYLLLGSKLTRKDGTLYYPLCSITRPACVLTALPIRFVWGQHMTTMVGASLTGAAFGSLFVVALWAMFRQRRSMGAQLRRAVQRRKLTVAYQPIVAVSTRSIVGAEALVRWTDEDKNEVGPDIFIAIAEEQGFLEEITAFVLREVMQDMATELRSGFRVSVNLSASDLADPGFLNRLESLVREARIPACSIALELTERSTANKDVVGRAIHSLRSFGHEVYVDDFGTGYSSLAYLHELSVDGLKMDRAFTNTIGTDSVAESIVPQIFAMASTLRLKIVVEGVEREEQAKELERMVPHAQAQGWLYGKPMPIAEFRALLKSADICVAPQVRC